jgi:hypothetical protein
VWQRRAHYIPHRKSDIVNQDVIVRGVRTSFTFRRVRNSPCQCLWPQDCDSQAGSIPVTRKQQALQLGGGSTACSAAAGAGQQHAAQQKTEEKKPAESGHAQDDLELRRLEEEHVHRVYNAIGSHFSATRCALKTEL